MTHFQNYWLHYISFLTALAFVVLYIKRGSVRGVFIGGKIRRTVGETNGADARGFQTMVRVHTLDSPDPSRAVAIEISTKVFSSLRWTPVTLAADDARMLSRLLAEAADMSSNNSFKPTPLRGSA